MKKANTILYNKHKYYTIIYYNFYLLYGLYMKVNKILTDEEMKNLKDTSIKPSMIHTIINKSMDVYKEDGTLLLRFIKGALKDGDTFYKNIKPFIGKHKSNNRGGVSGSTKKDVKYNPDTQTMILGYMDTWSPMQKFMFKKLHFKPKINVRQTMYNIDEPEKYKNIIPFIQQIDKLYKKNIPDKYIKQRKKADETPFKIDNTAFTTATINLNFKTRIHKDKGDDEEGFGNLTVIKKGNYEGGETCFPQYGIGVNVQNSDILFMDVHEWHGNLPLKNESKDSERMSIICYLRKGVWLNSKNKTKSFMEKHNKSIKGLRGKITF